MNTGMTLQSGFKSLVEGSIDEVASTMACEFLGNSCHFRFPSFHRTRTRFATCGIERVERTPGTLATCH